jgi:hypothetical protein
VILVGNARGGAKDLALHLMKDENTHIEVHELRGFAADTLMDALRESYAVSRGTRCRKHLYSLSLSPPPEARVSTADFEAAIERVEERLGLTGQPRAIVFHEKDSGPGGPRRHAHAVWSRIKTDEMKAVHLFRDREKLRDVSRELFLELGCRMPRGLMDSKLRDPRNFTLAEWQQARRAGKDPREIKATIQECWAVSDSRASFEAALRERGLRFARGDQRGFVALDHEGEAYAVYRWAGVKAKDVAVRLGDPATLPSTNEAKAKIAQEMGASIERLRRENLMAREAQRAEFEKRRAGLAERQRAERAAAFEAIEKRHAQESLARQQRFRSGVGGLWDRLRGEHARTRKQNEAEALAALRRDRAEKDALIFRQLEERQRLTVERLRMREQQLQRSHELRQDRARYRTMDPPSSEGRRRGEGQPRAREQSIEERRRAQSEPQPQRQRPEHDRER